MSINYADVTISGDAITLSGTGIYRVETQGGASTDDIATISGVALHDIIELRPQVSGHWWTLRHSIANGVLLMDGLDFTPASLADHITLRVENHGAGDKIVEMVPRTHIPTS